MDNQTSTEPTQTIPMTSAHDGLVQRLTEDVVCYTDKIVNVYFVGNPSEPHEWFLVDCGISRKADVILSALKTEFGEAHPPKMIVLTHGHFDHVGAAYELASHWNVKAYCHKAELPFVTGKQDYPKPDPTVEGGMVAKISGAFPYQAINLNPFIEELPESEKIDGFSDWGWIHTPGHSPGQIALYRERDGALLSADAIITVKQDSLYDVITQSEQLQGPPRYLTTDWHAAKKSAELLQDLQPNFIGPGHGLPMFGEEFKNDLKRLVSEFDQVAIPDYGKYTDQ